MKFLVKTFYRGEVDNENVTIEKEVIEADNLDTAFEKFEPKYKPEHVLLNWFITEKLN